MTAEKYQLVIDTIRTASTPERMVRIIIRLTELERTGECTPREFDMFMRARSQVERERGRWFAIDVYKLYAARKQQPCTVAS